MLPYRDIIWIWRPFWSNPSRKHIGVALIGRSTSSWKMYFSTIGNNPSKKHMGSCATISKNNSLSTYSWRPRTSPTCVWSWAWMMVSRLLLWSSKTGLIRIIGYNPTFVWASCSLPHGMKGNICKHQIKVPTMMHPKIAEGNIASYCGSLMRTPKGRL